MLKVSITPTDVPIYVDARRSHRVTIPVRQPLTTSVAASSSATGSATSGAAHSQLFSDSAARVAAATTTLLVSGLPALMSVPEILSMLFFQPESQHKQLPHQQTRNRHCQDPQLQQQQQQPHDEEHPHKSDTFDDEVLSAGKPGSPPTPTKRVNDLAPTAAYRTLHSVRVAFGSEAGTIALLVTFYNDARSGAVVVNAGPAPSSTPLLLSGCLPSAAAAGFQETWHGKSAFPLAKEIVSVDVVDMVELVHQQQQLQQQQQQQHVPQRNGAEWLQLLHGCAGNTTSGGHKKERAQHHDACPICLDHMYIPRLGGSASAATGTSPHKVEHHHHSHQHQSLHHHQLQQHQQQQQQQLASSSSSAASVAAMQRPTVSSVSESSERSRPCSPVLQPAVAATPTSVSGAFPYALSTSHDLSIPPSYVELPCGHTLHVACFASVSGDGPCPLCRFNCSEEAFAASCATCHATDASLWVCLLCGACVCSDARNIGRERTLNSTSNSTNNGSVTEAGETADSELHRQEETSQQNNPALANLTHREAHFRGDPAHHLFLQSGGLRVWDARQSEYVHRVVSLEGGLTALTQPHWRENLPWFEDEGEVEAAMLESQMSKMEQFYTDLLLEQLQAQDRYFLVQLAQTGRSVRQQQELFVDERVARNATVAQWQQELSRAVHAIVADVRRRTKVARAARSKLREEVQLHEVTLATSTVARDKYKKFLEAKSVLARAGAAATAAAVTTTVAISAGDAPPQQRQQQLQHRAPMSLADVRSCVDSHPEVMALEKELEGLYLQLST